MSKFTPLAVAVAVLTLHQDVALRAGILDDLYGRKTASRPVSGGSTPAATRPVPAVPAATAPSTPAAPAPAPAAPAMAASMPVANPQAIAAAPSAPVEDEFEMPLVISPPGAGASFAGSSRFDAENANYGAPAGGLSPQDRYVMPVASAVPNPAPCGYDLKGNPLPCSSTVVGPTREVRPSRLAKMQGKLNQQWHNLKKETCYPPCPPYGALNFGYSPTHWRRMADIPPQYAGIGTVINTGPAPSAPVESPQPDAGAEGNGDAGVMLLPPPLTPGTSPKQDP